jgi:hypothetical protein
MSLYSPAKCFLKFLLVTLPACSLCFLCLCLLTLADSRTDQWAMAAVEGNATDADADQADFSQSEMRCLESQVRERGWLTYEIVLRNTGKRRPESVSFGNSLSSNAVMLVSTSPELAYNVENRILHWQGNVDPGEERRFTVNLITLPGSYGNLIINHADILWDGMEKHLQIEDKVVLPEEFSREQFLFVAGGIGFSWFEIMMLGYLLFIPSFLVVVPRMIRRRDKQRFEANPTVSWHDEDPGRIKHRAMSIALLLSLAFMPLFLSSAIDDMRRFVSYKKTTCTILDKKAGWLPGSRGGYPIVAVRYDAGRNEIVAAGPLAKGASSRGTSAQERIAPYELGASYPCWFDPNDPRKFVLKRGDIDWRFYLLFLPPLVLFLIPFRYFRKRLRRPSLPRDA